MNRNFLGFVVSGLMALTLVIASCGPVAPTTPTTPTAPAKPTVPATPTAPTAPTVEKPQQEAVKPAPETPKYGGVFTVARSGDQTSWDPIILQAAGNVPTYEAMWIGDWARGPAAGYGTNEINWAESNDRLDLVTGAVAESWKWTADWAKNQGIVVYQIRQGMRFALNPNGEASRLVGGRQVTTDDVVFSLMKFFSDQRGDVYRRNPELRDAKVAKTGPWEVTITLALDALITGVSRMGAYGRVAPPEVYQKYGDMNNWKNSVGSGAFILNDYVAGSQAVLVRNPSYWRTDPVGPGKGNQLPYLNGFRILVIPDYSTRLAALRTGKIDRMGSLTLEEANQMRKTAPLLMEIEGASGGFSPTYINITRKPFNDVRVRRAMTMALNFQSLNQGLFGGKGQVLTYPYAKVRGWEELYLGLDDPEMPESGKELYVYNPEKAKQLLKEAGYPNGFKTSVLITSADADYYSIIKDMWAKVGIELALDVRESGVRTNLHLAGEYDMTTGGRPNESAFLRPTALTSDVEFSRLKDAYILEMVDKMRIAAITDLKEAMRINKELMKYVIPQAFGISTPAAPSYVFWWPWVKNYTGEERLGYGAGNTDNWVPYIWYDETLKKSMGY